MLTLAVFSKEGELLACHVTFEAAMIFHRLGLVVKFIEEPHDGVEEK